MKGKILIISSVFISLFIFNYFYTFSGFIPRTQTERVACELIHTANELSEDTYMKKEWVNKISDSNYKIYTDYKYVIRRKHCKTLNQFYIEQIGLILLAIGGVVAVKYFHKN